MMLVNNYISLYIFILHFLKGGKVVFDKLLMESINKKEIEKSLDALIEQNTPNEDIISYLECLELGAETLNDFLIYIDAKTNEEPVLNDDKLDISSGSVDSNIKHYLQKISCYELLDAQTELMYAKIILNKDDYDDVDVSKAKDGAVSCEGFY